MFYYLYIFVFFMQNSPSSLIHLESNYNISAIQKETRDYDYIYDFLKKDITIKEPINDVHKIQAYNTIRIIWENLSTLQNVKINKNTIMYIQALHKARKYLLALSNLKEYSDDSGLQLAIALSYFLEGYTMQYEKIRFHLQQWVKFGHEIPKNLVKMTDYKDSIQTITLLCIGAYVCNNKTLP